MPAVIRSISKKKESVETTPGYKEPFFEKLIDNLIHIGKNGRIVSEVLVSRWIPVPLLDLTHFCFTATDYSGKTSEKPLYLQQIPKTSQEINMNERKSIICPGCRKLVSDYMEYCPHCQLKNPGQKQKLLSTFGFNIRSFVKPIIFVNVVFFILAYALPLFIPIQMPMGRDFLGLLPSPSYISLNLLGWADIRLMLTGNWWVLITAIFLHGGILHILFNMLWVRDLGPQTEHLFGPHKMLIIFILSGIAGNLVAVFTPLVANSLLGTHMSLVPVIGASGAVFGLMGAIIAFGKKRGGIYGRQLVRQLGMWALILIVMGFLLPGVSNAAHIGGFIGGFIIGQILSIRRLMANGSIAFWLAVAVMGLCVYSVLMMILRLFSIVSSI